MAGSKAQDCLDFLGSEPFPFGSRMPVASEDARKDKRVSIVQEVACEGETGKCCKRLADISVGGMFIERLTEFAPDSVITVRFRLGDSETPITASAKVVYVQGRIGTGVQFLDLKPEDRARIENVVHKLSSLRRHVGGKPGKLSRIMVTIPIVLLGTDMGGQTFEEETVISALAKNGASLQSKKVLDVNAPVYLEIPKGAIFEGRVTWVEKDEVWIQCRGLAHSLGFNFP